MKAQASAELIIIFAFILVMFLFVTLTTLNREVTSEEMRGVLEMREECLRISNTISSVYLGGNGTEATMDIQNYMTLPGDKSIILVESINWSVEPPEKHLAIVASEAGETTQSFFDNMTEMVDPDWYKTCFSDIGGGADCQEWQAGGMTEASWNSIPWDIDDLVKNLSETPGSYQTVYIEDPHIQFNASYNGTDYFSILGEWVSKGNVLILSEHVRCREKSSGSYEPSSYECNPPNDSSDVWEFLGVELHQTGQRKWTEIVNESAEFGLSVGDQFKIEEANWLDAVNSTQLYVIGRYQGENGEVVITYWDYGDGRVYYFADFQITDDMPKSLDQEEYTEVLSNVIDDAYSALHFSSKAEVCVVPVHTGSYQSLFGMVRFTNDNGKVIAEVVGDG